MKIFYFRNEVGSMKITLCLDAWFKDRSAEIEAGLVKHPNYLLEQIYRPIDDCHQLLTIMQLFANSVRSPASQMTHFKFICAKRRRQSRVASVIYSIGNTHFSFTLYLRFNIQHNLEAPDAHTQKDHAQLYTLTMMIRGFILCLLDSPETAEM